MTFLKCMLYTEMVVKNNTWIGGGPVFSAIWILKKYLKIFSLSDRYHRIIRRKADLTTVFFSIQSSILPHCSTTIITSTLKLYFSLSDTPLQKNNKRLFCYKYCYSNVLVCYCTATGYTYWNLI